MNSKNLFKSLPESLKQWSLDTDLYIRGCLQKTQPNQLFIKTSKIIYFFRKENRYCVDRW